ncbi:helix-turn-helix transcriptional regulator [Hazenella sp. IB182357]|uniref:Helix-turn-helix transcriptional regulator n=1 Tax=Polycladospora coralii TaxID=2771432 RepID=A0A926NEY1_9BACL|nr:metalloregulator ArsR/SmtB family transcription factor [Polycladospora coralii]MBD1372294.1 helix-turn-helix transcriptional regulator [Polycladospora coralii]MBS7531516.1 helix-turn-helix transcriptional regulator [Polycladospora coralii]
MGPYSIDINDYQSIMKFFTALGDPIRLQIVYILGDRGKLNVSEIAKEFEISRPSISHHLKILRDAQILESKKMGQEVFYWLARDIVASNLQLLADTIREMNCSS